MVILFLCSLGHFLKMKIFVVVFLIAAVFGFAFVESTCPATAKGLYYQVDEWCYIPKGLTDDVKANFKDANDNCKKLDTTGDTGSLAIVRSQKIQSLLSAMLAYLNYDSTWIGLSQGVFQKDFEWVDGSALDYNNWAPTQPDGSGLIPGFGKDCAELVNDLHHPGRWYDIQCYLQRAYICQVKALDMTIEQPTTECAIPGYINFFTSCFRFYPDPKTFDGAQQVCKTDSPKNGFVASTDTGYENAVLEYILYVVNGSYNSSWIGLSKDTVTSQFKWLDGYPLMFTNWNVNEPNSDNTERACTRMVTGESGAWWEDVQCDNKLPFFCKNRIGGNNPPIHPPMNGTCLDGWISQGTNCYLFPTAQDKLSFNRAQYKCFLNYGSRLVSIHTSLENNYLQNKALDLGYGSFWIGLERDANVQGNFRWQDDSPLDYENWAHNEPNNKKCAMMAPDPYGQWKDDVCSQTANYVCMMPQFKEENPPVSTQCPDNDDWLLSGDYCYMVSDVEERRKTHDESEEWCNKHGGHLASITSQKEQDFINSVRIQISPKFWIGLEETGDKVYEWNDGSKFSYTFWDDGEPNDFAGEEKCVGINTMQGGKWHDQNCGVMQNFICKKLKTASGTIGTPTEKVPTGGCAGGWVQAKGKCFKAFTGAENQKTRMDAAVECHKYNGYLAVIANVGEQAILTTLMEPSNETLWIGLSNIDTNNQYHWTDGSSLHYTNWAEGRPDEATDNQLSSCAVMMNSAIRPGLWKDVPCSTTSSYACTTDVSPDKDVQQSYLHSCSKKSYISFHDSCFLYDATPRTFDEAKQFCSSDGSSLATIRDDYEDVLGMMLMYVNNVQNTWIGLRKNKETGAFSWVDTWPFLYSNWLAGQPGGLNNPIHECAGIGTDGYWYDTSCTDKLPTVCKYTTAPLPPKKQTDRTGDCLEDWVLWGDNCYLFDTNQAKTSTWADAASACGSADRNGYLASIHSKAENQFILEKAKAVLGVDSVWIRMIQDTDRNLVWAKTDLGSGQDPNDLVDYVNWASYSRESYQTPSTCAKMLLKGDGQWKLTFCQDQTQFVCKRPREKYEGLSSGALAGVIIGSILGVALIALAVVLIILKVRSQRGSMSLGVMSFGVKDTAPIVDP